MLFIGIIAGTINMSISLTNTKGRYGLVMISLHWSMAVMIIALFVLGVYMRGLSYQHPFYHLGPHLHESFGLIAFALLLFRLVWSIINPKPEQVSMPIWESFLALVVHKLFYILLFVVMICGYLIPTANGRAIELFNWFEVPAFISNIDRQEDIAGKLHYIVAMAIAGLTILHTMAALKHHFIDRDEVLRQMLGLERRKP